MKKVITLLSLLLLTCFLPASVHALTYSYRTFDYPGDVWSAARGINNLGNIVGIYDAGTDWNGYQYDPRTGIFTPLVFPFTAYSIEIFDINDSGDIVGDYFDGTSARGRGFVREGGTYTRIDYPGSNPTNSEPWGINNSGKISGYYYHSEDGDFYFNAFTKDETGYHSFSHPEAVVLTIFTGINNYDKIVGYYQDSSDIGYHRIGFLLEGGSYMPFVYSPGIQTYPYDINDSDHIVGFYIDGDDHGFLKVGSDFYTIDFPGGHDTRAYGINNSGIIVGRYHDADDNLHGFIATPVPAEQIENIQEFFSDSVINGDLTGLGPTETAAAGKLNALGNMLEEAEYLIDSGYIEEACNQLNAIYMKTDGAIIPPDFVTGDAADELAAQILTLMDTLGCE